MKEILHLILSSLSVRLAAADKIEDRDVSDFVKRLARNESRLALSRAI